MLAVEAQGKRNQKKEASWAYYVAYLQSKYGLPVLLLVVCQDRATAKWAAGPFDCGTRGWTVQRTCPLVVGPDNLPVITDVRTAAEKPAMAAFSALAHANSPEVNVILDVFGHALAGMDGNAAGYFWQFLDSSLGDSPAGDTWRDIMTFVNYFPGRGTLLERTYLEGEAKGEAAMILRLLEKRGIPVSEDIRERITSCADLDTLTLWFDRALTAAASEDLFTEDPHASEEATP